MLLLQFELQINHRTLLFVFRVLVIQVLPRSTVVVVDLFGEIIQFFCELEFAIWLVCGVLVVL